VRSRTLKMSDKDSTSVVIARVRDLLLAAASMRRFCVTLGPRIWGAHNGNQAKGPDPRSRRPPHGSGVATYRGYFGITTGNRAIPASQPDTRHPRSSVTVPTLSEHGDIAIASRCFFFEEFMKAKLHEWEKSEGPRFQPCAAALRRWRQSRCLHARKTWELSPTIEVASVRLTRRGLRDCRS